MTNTDPLEGSGLSADTKGDAMAQIPENARVVPIDMDNAAFVLIVQDDGKATLGGKFPRDEMPAMLRHFAAQLDPSHDHHEDIATVTLHLHEDELTGLARALQQMPWTGSDPVVAAAKGRMLTAADTVLHAQRARRRTPKV